MKLSCCHRLAALFALTLAASAAQAMDFVSVSASSAILYNAPSTTAKKLFVVNRYMPFEQLVTLESWVKVRDRSGGMYWVEKRVLSSRRYVFAVMPLVDVHTAPDAGSKRVFQVRQQVVLELVGATGAGWLMVRHQDGNVGYVRKADVWGG